MIPEQTRQSLRVVRDALGFAKFKFADPENEDSYLTTEPAVLTHNALTLVRGLARLDAVPQAFVRPVEEAYLAVWMFRTAYAETGSTDLAQLRRRAEELLWVAWRTVDDLIYVNRVSPREVASQDAADGASLARAAPLGGE
jgi:hypothetical protein